MLTATLLALGAAVLHAGWNLTVKQSGDRFIALWAQFFVAGAVCLVVLIAVGGLPAHGWIWAAISGAIHLPYCWFLARAYDHGDFSLVYPVARGGGALLAAIGGIVLLGDHLSPLAVMAILLIATGLIALAGRAMGTGLSAALVVAATIGVYSVSDAQGIRSTGTPVYVLASFVGTMASTTIFGLMSGRRPAMVAAIAIRLAAVRDDRHGRGGHLWDGAAGVPAGARRLRHGAARVERVARRLRRMADARRVRRGPSDRLVDHRRRRARVARGRTLNVQTRALSGHA